MSAPTEWWLEKSALEIDLIGNGLLDAAHFELLWLM
jgi:hypothetical protein